ncbi:helix-turn-helix domain-containing protein [Amycolatopsis magusensis]|uniref:Transcriptional regulator with XRE-family HTH domain n=1 Tax=Amycolatopsis magusensis TaxID=882444 RepID=A0ABS4PQJ1_9PSEU|nr:helix-turn-helix transcriptional regulator [Amycolatopsis magusensis]MBP2181686.1 transcriptional regulator with XRE-family HTH domain [Amycolatopsis magusensis]
MQVSEEARLILARRLKELREQRWPARRITQGQLANALAVSTASISAWENTRSPTPPPVHRLEAYATFFATERSVAKKPYRVPGADELATAERSARDDLLAELTRLRTEANVEPGGRPEPTAPVPRSLWRFDDDRPITIVCGQLPPEMLTHLPYADPLNPDYVRLYTYADPDALLELYGHVRALNPGAEVHYKLASEMAGADYAGTHLISLGGVDWNNLTQYLLARLPVSVRQETRPTHSTSGHFEVTEGGERKEFHPVLGEIHGQPVLLEDVAHFYRGPSPYNREFTVSLCNGMYGRGTLGAVRSLTDPEFGARNEEYAERRFSGSAAFSILARVAVVNGRAVAPDWTDPDAVLHEWSEDPL